MPSLLNLLYSAKILRLSLHKVRKWKESRNVSRLEYALKHGQYDVREEAVKALAELGSVSGLREAIDDPVKRVSFAAMQALEQWEPAPDVQQAIESKKAYWAKKDRWQQQKLERLKQKKKTGDILKWDRTSTKTLDNLKQMLKKPMNTGKWL